jgi:hypothetical protein
MSLLIDIHQQLLKKLFEEHVDFIVVGGYSVIYHGYQRTTGDIDIWLRPHNENKMRLLPVLQHLGLGNADVAAVSNFDFEKRLMFCIGEEPEKIDFLTKLNLVDFEEANHYKVFADIDGLHIPFLHLNHLILSKINTGRLKDQADIERLQQIHSARGAA